MEKGRKVGKEDEDGGKGREEEREEGRRIRGEK